MMGTLCLGLVSCRPHGSAVLDDDQNPYIKSGLNYRAAFEYDGAIRAFEKALEDNPNSVRAHYELGLLYDKEKHDYVTGLYHYNRVLKLQPKGYPAENVRLLVASCRQELVKAEALAPVARAMQTELEKLRAENAVLREQLEKLKAHYAARLTQDANAGSRGSDPSSATLPHPASGRGSPVGNDGSLPSSVPRVHVVQKDETLASISRLYHVKLRALIAANPGIEPRSMAVGRVVKLPSP
jgi:tetratricopeptide (TPR) repeat protein